MPAEDEALFQFEQALFQPFRLLLSNKYRNCCNQHLLDEFPAMPEAKVHSSTILRFLFLTNVFFKPFELFLI